METLRILVADDHELVRRGLKELLESQPGWHVVAEAATGREAVETALRLKPDIIVLDLSMPQLNGLEAARQILKATPRTELLILTVNDSEELVNALLVAGARGFLLKSDAGRDLVTAVDSLRQHRPFFTARIARMLLEGYLQHVATVQTDGAPVSLTAREREILQLIAEGKSNKEVAATLQMAVKTAEAHRANVMRKLDLHSVSDLVHYAVRNRIVQP